MRRILYLLICVTVGIACVIVFASCASQNNESDYDTHDTPHYYENEISDNATHDANDDFEIIEYDFVAGWWGNNPWRADYNLEYMPVFRNHFHSWPAEIAQHEGLSANMLSAEEMTQIAKDIIIALGYEVERVSDLLPALHIVGGHEKYRSIIAVSGNIEVAVGRNGLVRVRFLDGLALPDGMIFSWNQPQDEAIEYLTEKFAPALGMEIRTFENTSDDIIERILDYHFNTIRFLPNLNGKLGEIERPLLIDIVLSDKVGYFPIITPEEAIELMLLDQGVWPFRIENESVPTREYIIDIQLVYFTSPLGRAQVQKFAPWYSILFISPAWSNYTHYYVPAIRADYLEANSAWAYFPHQ